jgi:hypothetical protein
MLLKHLLLLTLSTVAPPGYSKYSVSPIQCNADECEQYKWSSFYNSYTEKETRENGLIRYSVIVGSIIDTSQIKLCLDDNLNTISDCKRSDAYKSIKFVDLVSLTSAAMIAESGMREDIEMGRGTAMKQSDDGGRGLGADGEVCLLQILPAVLAKKNIEPASLLGDSQESLGLCFSTGMDMLVRSKGFCSNVKSDLERDWVFETFSLYGTGNTCFSANNGKTPYRRSLFSKISSDFGARIKAEKKKSILISKSHTLPKAI